MYLWKIRCTEKMKFYIKKIHLKKLFDVLHQFSLRKHSAKAVSSGFFICLRELIILVTSHLFILSRSLNCINYSCLEDAFASRTLL